MGMSLLAWTFLSNISASNLWDIIGLQGDKNGNTRPRQPGGKDAHGKVQVLPQDVLGSADWFNF